MKLGILIALSVVTPAAAVEFDLRVVDEAGSPLPSRVLVRTADGKCITPKSAAGVLAIGRDRWFASTGRTQLDIPEGAIELRVERGHEFVRHKERVAVVGTKHEMTVRLKRWIDMRKRGYLCGENHLHVATKDLGPMAVCEGLDFASSLTWWNGPDARRPVPEGDGPTRQLKFAGRGVTVSVHDAELEYGWGAAYIQHLPKPLPFPPDKTRPNLDYLRHAVEAGGIVHYRAAGRARSAWMPCSARSTP